MVLKGGGGDSLTVALVTGANGFLGAWLCRRLAARGDTLRALVRETNPASLSGLSAQQIRGDVTEPASLEGAFRGVDVVYHLAGIRRAPAKEAFFRVNAEGTRAVCEAMVRQGARRLVLCSSLAASGPSTPDHALRESDPFHPAEWYGESKVQAEQIAFSFADWLEVTACRPARIVGPGDKENLFFFKIVQAGFRLVIGGPPRPMSFVDVEDVVDLLLLLGQRPEAVGQAFFSTGEVLTVPQLLDMVAQVLQVRTRTLYVPAPALPATPERGRLHPANRGLVPGTGVAAGVNKVPDSASQPRTFLMRFLRRESTTAL
jgi:dihydroflavonol-4-reductase